MQPSDGALPCCRLHNAIANGGVPGVGVGPLIRRLGYSHYRDLRIVSLGEKTPIAAW
jgi:hypothetical protein